MKNDPRKTPTIVKKGHSSGMHKLNSNPLTYMSETWLHSNSIVIDDPISVVGEGKIKGKEVLKDIFSTALTTQVPTLMLSKSIFSSLIEALLHKFLMLHWTEKYLNIFYF